MDVYHALDKINNDEPIDLSELENARWFASQLIEDRAFLMALSKAWGHPLRKDKTISGDFLPITVSILNRDESPAKQVYFGSNVWVVVYYGICPELEDFVTIVLWPSSSEASRRTYSQIVEMLNLRDHVLSFGGKYALNLPNEIHPAWASSIDRKTQESSYYDWKFYPFLKEVGDYLLCYGSPANYRRVFLRDNRGELREEYVNLKVVVSVVLDMRPGQILIKTPHLDSRPRPFWFDVQNREVIRRIEIGHTYYLLVLQKPLAEKTEIIDIQSAGIHDFIAQIIAHRLYNHYLKQAGLLVASQTDFVTQFKDALDVATATLGHAANVDLRIISPQMLFQYLQPFFRAIHNNIYYVPKILALNSDEEVLAFDRKLEALGKYGQGFGKSDFLPKRVISHLWPSHNAVQFLKCLRQFVINREVICQVKMEK